MMKCTCHSNVGDFSTCPIHRIQYPEFPPIYPEFSPVNPVPALPYTSATINTNSFLSSLFAPLSDADVNRIAARVMESLAPLLAESYARGNDDLIDRIASVVVERLAEVKTLLSKPKSKPTKSRAKRGVK